MIKLMDKETQEILVITILEVVLMITMLEVVLMITMPEFKQLLKITQAFKDE